MLWKLPMCFWVCGTKLLQFLKFCSANIYDVCSVLSVWHIHWFSRLMWSISLISVQNILLLSFLANSYACRDIWHFLSKFCWINICFNLILLVLICLNIIKKISKSMANRKIYYVNSMQCKYMYTVRRHRLAIR